MHLDNDYSIRVYQSSVEKYFLYNYMKNISYYAVIILNAFSDLLCSKSCWHNWLVPREHRVFCCHL